MKKKQLSKRAKITLAWMASDSDISLSDLKMFRNVGKATIKEIEDFFKETIGIQYLKP